MCVYIYIVCVCVCVCVCARARVCVCVCARVPVHLRGNQYEHVHMYMYVQAYQGIPSTKGQRLRVGPNVKRRIHDPVGFGLVYVVLMARVSTVHQLKNQEEPEENSTRAHVYCHFVHSYIHISRVKRGVLAISNHGQVRTLNSTATASRYSNRQVDYFTPYGII